MDFFWTFMASLPVWAIITIYLVVYAIATVLVLFLFYSILWRAVRRGMREYVIQRDRMDPMALPVRPFN